MLLKDQLKKESVEALKAGNKKKVGMLRYLVSLLDKKEMQLPPGQMKSGDELAVLKKELKNKEESREMFEKAKRAELVAEVEEEIVLVKKYLPQEMGEDELKKIIDEVLGQNEGANFGQIMGQVMAKTEGRADGTLVAKMVSQKISGK